ncbi:heat-shock protein, putative [Perkinsus marinus ATCC 50983]|uniref:Heat-shock protein, putative n=1 Tax=Perkinsus marinus (strain ATCC 50983 / TXsc) TaxID=423536 RepID=C5LDP0_PERM5|nr:heat-shock protein, putative [Perkinsus marinus ATCC 50983]EER05054.1 heat-shock protein, putative [Perkinsus marinus ATCC 50983]|eukprot:XP_002773238.1 heat-shock protein, putative [Perkinsus marinus ATCC 50983]
MLSKLSNTGLQMSHRSIVTLANVASASARCPTPPPGTRRILRPWVSGTPTSAFMAAFSSAAGNDQSVATHEFKTETRKLLDIVAKSLYTDKEVFIRELVSNASDACEKLRFLETAGKVNSLADPDTPIEISITIDPKHRLFIIQDSGIGMTKNELIENLGTIARSGSKEFITSDKSMPRFGVGFYSSFVVADKVEVFSRSADAAEDGEGHVWESDGQGSFTIKPVKGLPRGTKIVLHLKEDAADFCKPETVKKAASKFSNFVDFPIRMAEGEKGDKVKINKNDALWMRTSASEEEHTEFYRFLSGSSYGEPMYSLMYHTDAPLAIKSVFYIPEDAPNRWLQQDADVQVSLYCRRVLIKKHANEIIPAWLHWVRGVVDCEDMPLNISRENMQDTALMRKLSTAVVRRILRFLADQARRDADKYNAFWRKYGFYFKAGLLEDQQNNNGNHKDLILKLLRFESSNGSPGAFMSLQEYVDSMTDEQNNIYYLQSKDRKTALASPYMEAFENKGVNVLLLTEDIDAFVVSYIENFKGKRLVSVDSEEEIEKDIFKSDDDEAEKKEMPEASREELESFVKEVLGERVNGVKFSDRLVNSPAVVTSAISPQMRRMMKQMMAQSGQGDQNDALQAIPMTLELNPDHPTVRKLGDLAASKAARSEDIAKVAVTQLFDNACIAAGMVEDPRTILDRLQKMLDVCVEQAVSAADLTSAGGDKATPVAEPAKEDEPIELKKME